MSLESNANNVSWMTTTDGWQIYEKELKEEFDKAFRSLRACKNDEGFYRTQGLLDGLEKALNLPSIIQARGELQGK